MGERLRGSIENVYDFIPPVSARGETGPVTVSLSKDTLRALDILLAQPGIMQKTRSDLVRAFIHFGVQAVDRMREVYHPAWRTAAVLGKQRLAFERQLALAEDLYAGARSFVESLAVALARDKVDEALVLWANYYQDTMGMPETEQAVMLRVLAEAPIAQFVAWLGRESGLVPEEFVPLELPITGGRWEFDEGLPVPPHVKAKREALARLGGAGGGNK